MKMNVIKSMEKRHEALLRKGENENEAFGVMVSEFDSTDEIRQELRIPEDQDSPTAASTIGSYPPSTPRELLHGYEAFRGCFAIAITAGVIYHILAVVMQQIFEAILGEDSLATTILFLLVAVGVSLSVYLGIQKSYWEEQLQWYQPFASVYHHRHASRGQNDTLTGRPSGTIMLVATAVFLLLGFLLGLWHSGQVAFLAGGILCEVVLILLGNRT